MDLAIALVHLSLGRSDFLTEHCHFEFDLVPM